MHQRTYISRILEEMATVPVKIRNLREAGRKTEAVRQVGDFYKTYIGNQRSVLLEKTPEELVVLLEMNTDVLEPLAAILAEEAELLQEEGQEELARRYGQKALLLFIYKDRTDTRNYALNRKDRIQQLQDKYGIS